ncbi:hypothetical protein HAX54_033005 [Datura stramonium]|uniref:Uncharacterized protein n=1 Tax=Datura stramonium TaxID=4076 RepID=A0ABS8SDD0_DATST|nr:hypothetical protein [Datura stramonium]
MKNGEFLNLYVVHVVNEAEVVKKDVGLTNLLTGTEIGESNVFAGTRATNVGDINTDHDVEKDLIDETKQYVEEHLDGVETDVESSSDSEEEGIPEEDSEVDER